METNDFGTSCLGVISSGQNNLGTNNLRSFGTNGLGLEVFGTNSWGVISLGHSIVRDAKVWE